MDEQQDNQEFDLQAQIDATNKLAAEAKSLFAKQTKLQQQLGLNPNSATVYEEKIQPSETEKEKALATAAAQSKPEKKGKRKRNSGLLKAVTRQGRI